MGAHTHIHALKSRLHIQEPSSQVMEPIKMSANGRTNGENVIHRLAGLYSSVQKNEMLPFAGKWTEAVTVNDSPLFQ